MKRLIVNADDFGLTAGVNEAIIKGHSGGLITSTTLLANGEAFHAAVAWAREAPRLGVGVHLNLTEGRPVAPPSSIPSLVDYRGRFARRPGALWRAMVAGRVKPAEVEKELRAQIEKVVATGTRPTHVDSHKHVHALPAVGRMTIRLAREFGIPAVRRLAEPWPELGCLLRRFPFAKRAIFRQFLAGRLLGVVSRGWSSQLRHGGVDAAEHLYGLTQTGFLDQEILRQILQLIPEGTSELMCHPGFVDCCLRRKPTRLLEQRQIEFEALIEPRTRRLAEELGIQLINYGDVRPLKKGPGRDGA